MREFGITADPWAVLNNMNNPLIHQTFPLNFGFGIISEIQGFLWRLACAAVTALSFYLKNAVSTQYRETAWSQLKSEVSKAEGSLTLIWTVIAHVLDEMLQMCKSCTSCTPSTFRRRPSRTSQSIWGESRDRRREIWLDEIPWQSCAELWIGSAKIRFQQ